MSTPIKPNKVPDLAVPIGQYYAATAVPPVSGVSGVGFFTGPWLIEGQNITIDYVRVPKISLTSQDINLSSVASTSYAHDSTELQAIVQATVYKVSSTDAYPVSGPYQQPQKFEFQSVSADYLGNTYGEVDVSTLGPRGRISTKLPYIHRREMTENELNSQIFANSLGTSSVIGATFIVATSGCEGGTFSNYQPNYQQFFRAAINPDARGSFLDNSETFAGGAGTPFDRYSLMGGYSTDQESLRGIINFIDSCAHGITECWLDHVPANRYNHSQSPYLFWTGTPNDVFTGLPNYQPWRHDYS